MQLQDPDGRDSASAIRKINLVINSSMPKQHVQRLTCSRAALRVRKEMDFTSHGMTGVPRKGNPTDVLTAKPTVAPACTIAVSGIDQAVIAFRPQRKFSDIGSIFRLM
jgi:hypothetical protein